MDGVFVGCWFTLAIFEPRLLAQKNSIVLSPLPLMQFILGT
jgi:hypothetical protein